MEEKRFCQSCGMFTETDDLLGTNADGSKSDEYCTYCYQNGAFTQDVSMEEMIRISLEHMRQMYAGDPSYNEQDALDKMNSFFPKLKRWKAQ